MVEAAGIEPASASSLPLVLHAYLINLSLTTHPPISRVIELRAPKF